MQLPDTKILKRRKRKAQPGRERSRFAFVKAMVLASADKRIQSGVSSAAQFGFDGHLVELPEEFVLQRPSIARSKVWEVNAGAEDLVRNNFPISTADPLRLSASLRPYLYPTNLGRSDTGIRAPRRPKPESYCGPNPKAQLENHGTGELRVCWQCPELGRTFLQRNDTF